MIEKEKHIGEAKMTEQPKRRFTFRIDEDTIDTKHLKDDSVATSKVKDGAITTPKLGPSVQKDIVLSVTNPLDTKYSQITSELRQMINSLQVGGIALSKYFGDREDIGITQKALTEMLGVILDKFSNVPEYIPETKSISFLGNQVKRDFTLTAEPTLAYSVSPISVLVTADCTGSITPFDYIKIYVEGELKAEAENLYVFSPTVILNTSSMIQAVGSIAGKVVTKEVRVVKEVPFFMGSGSVYTDVMNASCQKELDGSIEGSYDVVVRNNNDYIFIIIPITSKDEYRRADMNGYEIPVNKTEMPEFVVYKSLNRYNAGTYNVDIDINS